jgi:hypothetical protein
MMASRKCVHKGCGKTFTDANEECVYHPGPPIFHEGQKGALSPDLLYAHFVPFVVSR